MTNTVADIASDKNTKLQISHAPQSPNFLPTGGYAELEKLTVGKIDYYNQGNWAYQAYQDFSSIFDLEYQGVMNVTSVQSIKNQDLPKIPYEKVIIGKPITETDVSGTGYIPMGALVGILSQAKAQNILFAGVVGWKIDNGINGSWGKALYECRNRSKA